MTLSFDLAPYPALARLDAHLTAHAGRLTLGDGAIALEALEEYMRDHARLGRSLREVTARFKPADEAGALLAYLYVITVDAATHEGRDAALGAYAASQQPFADMAARLYAVLSSDAFRVAVGRRPREGGPRGCSGSERTG